MGYFLIIAIIALALVAKVIEIVFSIKAELERKKNRKIRNSYNRPTQRNNTNYTKSSTNNKTVNTKKKEQGTSSKTKSKHKSGIRFTPNMDWDRDFVMDTMASQAHNDAVRMHNEASDNAVRMANFAHEEAVRMNNWNNFENDIFMHDTAVHQHEFMNDISHFDSMSMHDTAINDAAFLNDMATSSFDMGFGGCGGFGMF